MAARKSTPVIDGTACTFLETLVDVVGTPEALADDDLIVPEWLPIAPKRLAAWNDWPSDWDDPHRDRDAVGAWELRRVAGGAFRLRIWPQFFRIYRGGPMDPAAPRRALARHRALVRARRDAQYQAFMAALTA